MLPAMMLQTTSKVVAKRLWCKRIEWRIKGFCRIELGIFVSVKDDPSWAGKSEALVDLLRK